MYKEDKSTQSSNHSWTFVSINKEIAWSFIRYLLNLERCRSSLNALLFFFLLSPAGSTQAPSRAQKILFITDDVLD